MYRDWNNPKERKAAKEALTRTIGNAEQKWQEDLNRSFTWDDMKQIEAVLERQEEIIEEQEKKIEDQEERIAIMTEGGWISVNDAMPDDYREVWVWTKGHHIDFGCHSNSYWSLNTLLVEDKDNFVTHWQYKRVPEPPKEGEA